MNMHQLRLVDAEVARRLRRLHEAGELLPPRAGDIGEGQREIELEPLEVPGRVPAPSEAPLPDPTPSAPVPVPEREPVPA